jgi:transposase
MQAMNAIIVSAPAALREQLDRVTGKMELVLRLAALRQGPITSTTASANVSLSAIARRWLALDDEIKSHDASLDWLTETPRSRFNPSSRNQCSSTIAATA